MANELFKDNKIIAQNAKWTNLLSFQMVAYEFTETATIVMIVPQMSATMQTIATLVHGFAQHPCFGIFA